MMGWAKCPVCGTLSWEDVDPAKIKPNVSVPRLCDRCDEKFRRSKPKPQVTTQPGDLFDEMK